MKKVSIVFLIAALFAAMAACDAQPEPAVSVAQPPSSLLPSSATQPEAPANASNAVLAGIGAQAEKEEEEYIYTIQHVFSSDWLRPVRWSCDKDGNIIPQEERYTVLKDKLTGEPQCRVRTKTEPLGGIGENGLALTRELSALYDLDGNLLHDWAEYMYYEGFGDYVIRQNKLMLFREAELPEDFVTELWNYKTGESAVAGAAEVMRLSDGVALLGDFLFKPLGTVDTDANKLSGFPAPAEYRYAQPASVNIVASNRPLFGEDDPANPTRYDMLTRDFAPIFSAEYIFTFTDDDGTYFDFYNTDSAGQIVHGIVGLDGKVILQCPAGEYFNYHDEEIAVLGRGEYGSDENPARFRLIRLSDGAAISAEGYEFFVSDTVYNSNIGVRKPTGLFLAYKEKTLNVIGRDGAILASRDLPGVENVEFYSPGLFRVSIRDEDNRNTDAIMDEKLNDIVPAWSYRSVMRAGGETVSGDFVYQDILLADQYSPEGIAQSTDVMDLSGNILIEGLSEVDGAGPNRLEVRSGFVAGLMDWEGNWIVKRSIFADSLND